MLDWPTVIQGLVFLLFGIGGYFYRDMKSKLEVLTKEFYDYKVHVSERYVTTDQLTTSLENLNRSVETVANGVLRIESRLNSLQDSRPRP